MPPHALLGLCDSMPTRRFLGRWSAQRVPLAARTLTLGRHLQAKVALLRQEVQKGGSEAPMQQLAMFRAAQVRTFLVYIYASG